VGSRFPQTGRESRQSGSQKADPERDDIRVDGVSLVPQQRPEGLYFLLHKPLGVFSTCDDPEGRKTVLQMLPPSLQQGQGIHPVGRLDANSTGALLLTNDGEFTFYLTHPKHQLSKTYRVWVTGHLAPQTLSQWRAGVDLDGQSTLPAQVKVLRTQQQSTFLEVILNEGRNRQIRRVAELLGHPVERLHRTAIGPVGLGDLPSGQFRPLTNRELRDVRDFRAISPSSIGRMQKFHASPDASV
jgi:pseudouridine synthase